MQVVSRDSQHLPFPNHLRRLDPLNHRPSRLLGPRSLHRAQPPFHMPVVGFNAIIAVAPGAMLAAPLDSPFFL